MNPAKPRAILQFGLVLLLGLIVGGVTTWSYRSWQIRRTPTFDDGRTWLEYVELLKLAEELTKKREEVDLNYSRDRLKYRLEICKQYAENSRDSSPDPFKFLSNKKWLGQHIEEMEEAIKCIETGQQFRVPTPSINAKP